MSTIVELTVSIIDSVDENESDTRLSLSIKDGTELSVLCKTELGENGPALDRSNLGGIVGATIETSGVDGGVTNKFA